MADTLGQKNTLKYIRIITVAGIIASAALRFLDFRLNYSITDEKTAFLDNSGMLSWISLAVILLCAVAAAALCIRDKDMYGEYLFKSDAVSGAASLICAASLVPSLPYMFSIFTDEELLEESTDAGAFMLPMFILSIIMIVFLIILGAGMFTGKNVCSEIAFTSFVPLLWSMMFIVFNYVHNTMFVIKTENYFVIAACASLVFAMRAIARNYAGFGNSARVKPFVIWTSIAAVTCTAYGISDVLMYFCGPERIRSMDITVSCVMLGMGIFALAALMTYHFDAQPKPEKETAAPKEENRESE